MTRNITTIITAVAAALAFAGMHAPDAAAITVNLPASGNSGLVLDFDDADIEPDGWGDKTAGGGGLAVGGGKVTLTDSGSLTDYVSTTDLDQSTAVITGYGEIVDYFIKLDIENTVATADFSRVFQADSSTGDLFVLRQQGTTIGDYSFHGTVETSFSVGAGVHELIFHYDASEDNFNVFVDQVEVLSDLGHLSGANAMFTNLRFGGNFGSVWEFDDFIVSAVPEPTTVAFLGLGVLALGGRRRCSG